MTRRARIALAAAAWWAASVSPSAAAGGGGPAREKLRALEDVLRSRNDNDPRLDGGFDGLSPEAKRLFRRRYRDTALEKRNERGTIVYLLGRNLRTREDWEFLRAVALESPCLSLGDCSRRPEPGVNEREEIDEVTLAYPSLVALRQARRALEEARAAGPAESSRARAALGVIGAAKASRTPAVARMAAALERRYAPGAPDGR